MTGLFNAPCVTARQKTRAGRERGGYTAPVTPRCFVAVAALAVACKTPNPPYRPTIEDAAVEDVILVDIGPAFRTLPTVPVGLDAYRQWDRMPFVRIGVRAGMRSTYDRSGGNEGADASHFLRADRESFYVPLDLEGPGVLYFARANRWHGSPWRYVVDGTDRVLTETSTATPESPVADSVFMPREALPSPLTYTWSATRGSDLNWVPAAFTRSLTLGYSRTHYGTGYFIFHRFAEGADHLSRPLVAWDGATPPDADVLALLNAAGSDIAPRGDELRTRVGTADVPAAGAVTLDATGVGPSMIRALRFSVSRERALEFGRARLRITWDDRATPSVDAPIDLFFGAGVIYNRDVREHLVKALLTNVRYAGENVVLSAYFPMPYFQRARIELVGAGTAIEGVDWQVRAEALDAPRPWVSYFHATHRDHGTPTPGRDLTFLDTREVEGGGDWCGLFTGTSFTFSDRANLSTLEGDPRFFFDDAESPQGYGTGTEEWAGGGDYWGGQTMTLPLVGHPVGVGDPREAQGPDDLIQSAYRHLIADAMPFGRNARIQFEHGGLNESTEHYRSVTYWYGRPGACLVPSDSLDVGDPADEAAHGYASAMATAPESLTSRYELGVDTVDGREVIPTVTDTGRHTAGTSEFTVRVDPDNVGVMLRRTFDYAWPDQRAEVSVAEDLPGARFERAGVWYTAGSNQCVYSNPATELGIGERTIQTSNRRWREDEFLVPRRFTENRRAVRIRVRHAPIERPLVPDGPARERAWSEFRYRVYSYVLPGA